MTHGTAPPPPSPPPPDHQTPIGTANETVINTEYTEDDLWMDPPDFNPPGPFDAEKHARRSANHSAYRAIGHLTIWKNYIYYGYYLYDDCQDFLKAWKATVHDRLERQRFIWREYHYRRLHNLDVSATLLNRVTEKTIPYLKEHDPDLWLASDMEYEEVQFFQDSGKITNIHTATEWHEVSPKRRNKKHTSNLSPELSPSTKFRKSAPESPANDMTPATTDTIEIVDSVTTPPRRTAQLYNPYKASNSTQTNDAMDIDNHTPKGNKSPITNPITNPAETDPDNLSTTTNPDTRNLHSRQYITI